MFEFEKLSGTYIIIAIIITALIVFLFRLIIIINKYVKKYVFNILNDSVQRHLCFEFALREHESKQSESKEKSDLLCTPEILIELEKESDNYLALVDWERFIKDLLQSDLIKDDYLLSLENLDRVLDKLAEYLSEEATSGNKQA